MTDMVMTIPETARWLGLDLKVTYKYALEGKLPGAMKIGGSWRVYKGALVKKFGGEVERGGESGAEGQSQTA